MNYDDILGELTVEETLHPMTRKKNYVCVALDCSGSMAMIRQEAMDFFNSQVVEAQHAKEMDNRMCLIFFSDRPEVKIWDVDANEVEPLKEYAPDGWTAMLDSIGLGITKLLQQPDINEPHVSVLFIIISDGQENASKEHTFKSIAEMINQVRETNRWSFVYMGASELDLSKVREMGISKDNTMLFSACAQGLTSKSVLSARSAGVFYNARAQGATFTSSFYDDNSTTGDDTSKKKTNT